MIKDYKGNVAVQSFSPAVVKWFKDNAPEATRGLLATGYQNLGMPEIVKKGMRLISRIVGLRVIRSIAPDFIAFNILSFPSRKMKMLRESGMPFLTWTVNKMNLLTEAKKYADNIIFERIDITEYKF
jgi:glycerophosphoryl diester phosphodiesterase